MRIPVACSDGRAPQAMKERKKEKHRIVLHTYYTIHITYVIHTYNILVMYRVAPGDGVGRVRPVRCLTSRAAAAQASQASGPGLVRPASSRADSRTQPRGRLAACSGSRAPAVPGQAEATHALEHRRMPHQPWSLRGGERSRNVSILGPRLTLRSQLRWHSPSMTSVERPPRSISSKGRSAAASLLAGRHAVAPRHASRPSSSPAPARATR
jgi:hypothetical protein